MKKIVAVACFALAACGAPQTTPTPDAPASEAAQPAGAVDVRDGWASPTPGGVSVSAGYLTIANGTAAEDRLISASSPRAARVEIHTMDMEGGVMRMRQLDALAVPAGGEVSLAPHGTHLMFIGVAEPFVAGEEIAVTLTFENAGAVETRLPVRVM